MGSTRINSRVRPVETVSPPITARASGMFVSAPSPKPTAIGIMAMIVASAVMRIGRSRIRPARRTASRTASPASCCLFE